MAFNLLRVMLFLINTVHGCLNKQKYIPEEGFTDYVSCVTSCHLMIHDNLVHFCRKSFLNRLRDISLEFVLLFFVFWLFFFRLYCCYL